MSNQIATIATPEVHSTVESHEIDMKTVERLLTSGDLAMLSAKEKIQHYIAVCDAMRIDYRFMPLQYVMLPTPQGPKLTLYVNKAGSDQLRKVHGVSIEVLDRVLDEKTWTYTVFVRATDRSGRSDDGCGSVSVLKMEKGADGKTYTETLVRGGDAANAFMKAETKAKRRVTLSICGLGMLDETELETIKGAKKEDGVALPVEVQVVS